MSILKKMKTALPFLLLLFLLILFLLSPVRGGEALLRGISLWAVNVLPVTFPLLVLTTLFTRQRAYRWATGKLSPLFSRLFRVDGEGGGIALLSAFTGYPVGAKALYDYSMRGGRVNSRVVALGTTSGPAFLFGTVGGIFYRSATAGAILMISHFAAIFLVAFLLRFRKGEGSPPAPPAPPLSAKGEAKLSLFEVVSSSVLSVLTVGALIALFSCLCTLLKEYGFFSFLSVFGQNAPYAEGILAGLLEMTTGAFTLSALQTPLSLALSAFLITFGGASVLCQQYAFLGQAGVKAAPFTLLKGAQGVLAALLCYVLALFLY